MSTLNIPLFYRRSKRLPLLPFASWPGTMVHPQWLELPISQTNFHGSNDVGAISSTVVVLSCGAHHKWSLARTGCSIVSVAWLDRMSCKMFGMWYFFFSAKFWKWALTSLLHLETIMFFLQSSIVKSVERAGHDYNCWLGHKTPAHDLSESLLKTIHTFLLYEQGRTKLPFALTCQNHCCLLLNVW